MRDLRSVPVQVDAEESHRLLRHVSEPDVEEKRRDGREIEKGRGSENANESGREMQRVDEREGGQGHDPEGNILTSIRRILKYISNHCTWGDCSNFYQKIFESSIGSTF